MQQTTKFGRAFLSSLTTLFFPAVICSQLFISCINNIPEEAPEAGDIPISLSTSKKNMLEFAGNGFGENDAIGLYIMVDPSSIANTRYIDNMKLSNNLQTGFSPQEDIFFPEGENKCNFISYYPYQNNAIIKGESTIKIETPTDQSTKSAFSTSDFMTATANGIIASESPVELKFEHKLFKLNILLEVISGYDVDMMLKANPVVKIKDVYTKANYNFITNKFTDHSEKADIIPNGTWVIEDEKLCGKSAIIIPQTIPTSHIIIELCVGNRLFKCTLEEERIFDSGVAENSTIFLLSSDDAEKVIITTSISEWTTQESTITGMEVGTAIQTSQLDFTNSNVLKVLNNEKQVAEICLEYLCTDQLKEQAIVIYPSPNGKTDLTQGIVLELKDETGNKHGGSVTWDKTNNTLTYVEGTSEAAKYIYITKDGKIKTSRPNNALQLQLKPDILTDKHGGNVFEYPIVKIGTQYWMRINFKPTQYTDGTNINHGGSTNDNVTVSNTSPQYYDRDNAYFFYNTTCVMEGGLIPYGWRIGNETDYTNLKTYIRDNASVLKNGTSWSNNTYGISNLSGFNAVATGYLNKTYTESRYYAAFWCANSDSPNVIDKIVTLSVNDNNITIKDATKNMAVVIKCIRN